MKKFVGKIIDNGRAIIQILLLVFCFLFPKHVNLSEIIRTLFGGDIVKRFDKLIEVVEWNDKKGWWCLNDGSIGLTTLGQWHQAIEIIGNIYENKELLTWKS